MERKMKPSTVLKKARKLIERGWTKDALARDKNGGAHDYDYPTAVSWCAIGAILAQVVEELGDAASGRFAKLKIRELPAGTKYRIDEYDGNESVVTMDEYEWSVA